MTTTPIPTIQGPPPVSAPGPAGRRRAPAGTDTANLAAPGPTAMPTGSASGNPSERLDPGLGLIVLSLHDATGQVTDSIPTARQLQAYRVWQQAQVGATPGPTPALPGGGPFPGADTPSLRLPAAAPPRPPLPAASPGAKPLSPGRSSGSG